VEAHAGGGAGVRGIKRLKKGENLPFRRREMGGGVEAGRGACRGRKGGEKEKRRNGEDV